jgi:hypothetical protein
VIGAALAGATIAGRWLGSLHRLQHLAPWLVLFALFVSAWEIVTAKLGLLPLPFFPPPQAILEVFLDDWVRLGESVLASLRLLAGGHAMAQAMPKPYSDDLRERVIGTVEAGVSRPEAAESSTCARVPRLNGFSAGVIPEAQKQSRTAVWRFFARHDFTFKKHARRGATTA